MDFHMKQWRNQHESEEHQHSTKMPKLALQPADSHHQQQSSVTPAAALPLFVPQQNSTKVTTNLSDSTFSPSSNRSFPIMGSHFSLSQWQELEYMLVGASVPPELLQPIKKSLLDSSPYFLHHYHPTACKFHTTTNTLSNLCTIFHITYFKTKQNKNS
ncbi:hypothetical protein RYX36_031800 [Vicia faba]